MPSIVWSSLVADDTGRIDYARVKSLAAVLLAFAGGAFLLAAGIHHLLTEKPVSHDVLLYISGVLVVPLTGGVVASGLQLKKQKAEPDA